MKIYGIRFQNSNKTYDFSSENEFNKDDKVIVETERGIQLGTVVSIKDKSNIQNIKPIIKKASADDYEKYLDNLNLADEALENTKKIIANRNINMALVDAAYSLNRDFLVFNFVADDRVDFRDLVKELASIYHTRIELHQIGVRDKAKILGGIGLCGRQLCCHGCLKTVNSVNINMVKNQNIALNPTKINGACGRLLCCFTYENDIYEENRKKLPNYGEKVHVNGKDGTVSSLDILNLKYSVTHTDGTTEEVDISGKE